MSELIDLVIWVAYLIVLLSGLIVVKWLFQILCA